MKFKTAIHKPLVAMVSGALIASTALIPSSVSPQADAASTTPTTTSASSSDSSQLEYDVLDTGVVITGLGKAKLDNGELVIPATIDGKPVVEIGANAFRDKSISKVTFSSSLEKIGDKAFQGNVISGDITVDSKYIGANAFAQNDIKDLSIKNAREIGSDAFRDNKIESISLSGDSISVGDRAFINNKISGDVNLSKVKSVGDEAFSINSIKTATVGTSTTLGNDVFSNNKSWVEIKSSQGSSDSRGVITVEYDSGYGQVVNPVSIVVHYVDSYGYNIAEDEVFGDDINNSKYAFGKGKESTFKPRNIPGYKLETPEITFTPDKDKYEITAKYVMTRSRAIITTGDGISVKNGEKLTRDTLLQGVSARDVDGSDITDKIVIDDSAVDTSKPGTYDVIYSVVDKNGNESISRGLVSVGIDWPSYEFGGGWQIQDFTFSGSKVTGFSSSGEAKLKSGKTTLWLPPKGLSGQDITTVAAGAFKKKGLTAIEDWGNISRIESSASEGAFQNNSISSLPDSWGKIGSIGALAFDNNKIETLPAQWGNVEYLYKNSFSTNNIKSLPQSWGKIVSIGYESFARNDLKELPQSWENVSTIDTGAFRENHITAIPKEWGKVHSLGSSAFFKNEITSIPDDWGKIIFVNYGVFEENKITSISGNWNTSKIGDKAFYKNQITSLPDDWGKVRTIGNSAFGDNKISSLPDSWNNVEEIGDYAFYENNITSIPDNWEKVKRIGDASFRRNNITSTGDSWGDVEYIGDNAFRDNSNLSHLPSSWSKVKRIGNYAFAYEKIDTLPDSWGDVEYIGDGAFRENSNISTLPSSWGKVAYIGNYAFAYEKIKDLPDSWGEVTTVGLAAFRNNNISELPDSWGKLKKVDEHAFYSNNIKELPNDWGNLTEIYESMVDHNPISTIPKDWGDITKINKNAFLKNNLPKDLVFTIKPSGLTEEFVKSLDDSDIPQPVALYTPDRTNPNNVASTEDVLINPVRVKYRYVDKNGAEIASPSTKLYPRGQKVSMTPPSFFSLGYSPVKSTVSFTTSKADDQTVNIVYSNDNLSQDEKTNIDLQLNNSSAYHIGDEMTGTIRIDRTGYDTETLNNARVYVTVDPSVYDLDSFDITTSSLNIDKNTFRRDGNSFSFVIPVLKPAQSTTIPFRVKFKENTTPSNTDHPLTATLVDDKDSVVRISQPSSFKGYYDQPYQKIAANNANAKLNGVIENYDRTVVNNVGENDAYVADDVAGKNIRNTISYTITNNNIHRTVGDYETRVDLPTYEVHPQSKLYNSKTPTRLAKFDPALNPGWKLSSDGKYVTFSGDNKGSTDKIINQLVLGYPGALEDQRIPVHSETTLIPYNKAEKEPVMLVSDVTTNHFARYTPPPGEILEKYPTGNHGSRHSNYFYDNTLERNGAFPWEIAFNAVVEFNNAKFRDFDLDDRMYYDTVTPPKSLGDVEVRVVDDRGATLQSQVVKGGGDRTVVFDKNKVLKGKAMIVEVLNHPIPQGTEDSIKLTTRMKNPDEKIYEDNKQNTIYVNRAELFTKEKDIDPVYAQKSVKQNVQEISAFKTQQKFNDEGKPVDNLITDDLIRYSVGFTPREGMGETITNIEQVDMLPVGVDVEDVTLSNEFSRLPGATYKVVENYRGTGQDAVIFTASSASPDHLNPGNKFTVGNITVRTNMKANTNRIDNIVYVKANNTQLANKVTNPPAGPGDWSKASVWTNYTAASDMSARKQIRAYGSDGKPQLWTSSVTTEPGVNLDYKLRLDNGTDGERKNLVVYDVFPHVGDVGIPSKRESAFSNTYDPSRKATIPAGYTIQYYNGATWPDHSAGTVAQKEAENVLSKLKWDSTPTKNTKAVRIVQKDGVSIKSHERVEFILPMKANSERLDSHGNPPADLVGPSAYNTYFWKDDHQPQLIEGNRVENKLKNRPVSVSLRKVAQSSNQPLEGARFELRNDRGDVVASTVSDAEGMVKFDNVDIKPQYSVVEVSAPRGYQLNNKEIPITSKMIDSGYAKNPAVIDLGDYINTLVPPAPKYGEVEFTKIDALGNPLQGTRFKLSNDKNSYEAESGKDGKVIFANITPGTYNLEEIRPSGNLQPISPISGVVVSGDKTTKPGKTIGKVSNAIANDKVKIELTKLGVNDDHIYDNNGKPKPFGEYQAIDGKKITGSTFQVIDNSTNSVVSTVKPTDADSSAYITNLEPNKIYKLNETVVPTGYEKVPGVNLLFKVDEKGNILNPDGSKMTVQSGLFVPNRNKTLKSTVNVKKVDQDDNAVKGASFVLQRKVGSDWINVGAAKTTSDDGVVSWTTSDSSQYRVVETVAPAGYVGGYVSPEFITNRTQSKTFTYTGKNVQVRPTVAKVEYIAQGLATRESALEIQKENPGSTVERGDDYNWRVIRYLKGATLEVRENDAQGKLIQTVTTGDDGLAKITAPVDPKKNYALVETAAPDNYELRTQPITFNPSTVMDYQYANRSGEIKVEVPNNRLVGRIVVSKLNASTHTPLTGSSATFEAMRVEKVSGSHTASDIKVGNDYYRPQGKTYTKKTSSSAGIAIFDSLDYGTYLVRETEAAKGYLMDSTPSIFEINKDNASHTFVFNNTPEEPKIKTTKYINGKDANSKATAVWLNNDASDMDVKVVAKNTGNTALDKVTITDVIQDAQDQYINTALKSATYTVKNEQGKTIKTGVKNGAISLKPGETVETTVKVKSPEKGVMHRDDVTATGYFGDIKVTDDDPAHAYRIPDTLKFILPATGAVPRFMLILLLAGTALALATWMSRRKKA